MWREAVCKENDQFCFPLANIKFTTEAAVRDSYWRSEGHRLGLSAHRWLSEAAGRLGSPGQRAEPQQRGED